jgi:5-methylcytosine-specific restriction endonuclease McrA
MERSRRTDGPRLQDALPAAEVERELAVLGQDTPTGMEPLCSALHNLRSVDLVRLLNSTPLGEVINERQLYRHRTRAGLRIGEARRIDLLKYIVWLIEQRQARTRKTARDKGRVAVAEVLQIIERQSYRCSLSGRLLTPQTACLDHIVPVSRGGKHQLENAQVLHKDVNRAKGTLRNEEFIQLCREVVAHADGIDQQ